MRALPPAYPGDPTCAACDLHTPSDRTCWSRQSTTRRAVDPLCFHQGWIDFWSNEVIHGPVTRHVQYGLDQFPLHVRADALIPTMQPRQALAEGQWDFVDTYMLEAGKRCCATLTVSPKLRCG
jgi:alpha-D-xyloside xylohydrolase